MIELSSLEKNGWDETFRPQYPGESDYEYLEAHANWISANR